MATLHLSSATLQLTNRPMFFKNQIWFAIKITFQVSSIGAIFIVPLFWLEVRGYAKLYDATADGPGWWYNIVQIPLQLIFIDFSGYWLHRFAHHPQMYSRLRHINSLIKSKVIITTPYATNYATHPMDIIELAIPFFLVPYVLPLQKIVHILTIVAFNLLTICNHDGKILINYDIFISPVTRSLHNKYRNCNFALIFTIFDRLHGTYRKPENSMVREERTSTSESKDE